MTRPVSTDSLMARVVALYTLLLVVVTRAQDGRVAYGTQANSKDYPSYVALTTSDGQFICGGSLIASSFVLTAAHCLDDITRVAIGDITKGGMDNQFVKAKTTVKIKKKIGHSGYNDQTFKNDVAILVLDKPLTGYNVAKLATSIPKSGSRLTVVGHGMVAGENLPKVLMKASMKVQGSSFCGSSIGEICLEAARTSKGGYNEICSGDSGGPAYSSAGVVTGVTSYGGDRPCGRNPWSVYQSVSYFSSFIRSTVAKYGGSVGGSGSTSPSSPSPSSGSPGSSSDDYDYDYDYDYD